MNEQTIINPINNSRKSFILPFSIFLECMGNFTQSTLYWFWNIYNIPLKKKKSLNSLESHEEKIHVNAVVTKIIKSCKWQLNLNTNTMKKQWESVILLINNENRILPKKFYADL